VLISVNDTRACEGSLNIDECTAKVRPGENRWDYCFAYKNEVFFVEVHPAETSDVETVINKLNWLKEWLTSSAPAISALTATTMFPFHWLHTGSTHIIPGSKQYRKATQHNILPKARLELKH
jgi:hypothetical protein